MPMHTTSLPIYLLALGHLGIKLKHRVPTINKSHKKRGNTWFFHYTVPIPTKLVDLLSE